MEFIGYIGTQDGSEINWPTGPVIDVAHEAMSKVTSNFEKMSVVNTPQRFALRDEYLAVCREEANVDKQRAGLEGIRFDNTFESSKLLSLRNIR